MAPTIDEVVERARRRLVRVTPEQAAAEFAQGALLVDTRTESQRAVQGEIPGAIVIDRTVLEWRLDPTSPSRIEQATDHQVRVKAIHRVSPLSLCKISACSTRPMSWGDSRAGKPAASPSVPQGATTTIKSERVRQGVRQLEVAIGTQYRSHQDFGARDEQRNGRYPNGPRIAPRRMSTLTLEMITPRRLSR